MYYDFDLFKIHIIWYDLQVTLHSEVKATLTIYDACLDLQDGFVHTDGGTPSLSFFPLVISASSKAGILFSICLDKENAEGNFLLGVICGMMSV